MKIEKVEVREIASKFGTPVYVYSLEILRSAIQEIKKLSHRRLDFLRLVQAPSPNFSTK